MFNGSLEVRSLLDGERSSVCLSFLLRLPSSIRSVCGSLGFKLPSTSVCLSSMRRSIASLTALVCASFFVAKLFEVRAESLSTKV